MSDHEEEENYRDPDGEGNDDERESQDSERVDFTTPALTMRLVAILQNVDAPEWDSGTVYLDNGQVFLLWSDHSPAPTNLPNERLDAFTARQRTARGQRIEILSQRAQRIHGERRIQREARRDPPPRISRSNSVVEAERVAKDKQALHDRLVAEVGRNTLDPRDMEMFRFMDQSEGEAARAVFQRVLDDPNQRGLGALTNDERDLLGRWKTKSEQIHHRRADESSRLLGLFQSLNHGAPAASAGRSFPIRTTCPKFSPGLDSIGSLETWLAGVQNFISLQRVTDPEDQRRVLFSSIDINAQFRLGERLLPNSPVAKGLSYEEYVEQVRLIFSPPEESTLWKTDYKNFRQSRGSTITDYLQKKGQLFKMGYRSNLDNQHFIEESISNIYHTGVKREVYRAAPTTFSALIIASQKAVGLIRLMESPSSPNAVGLASISHPAPVATSSASARSSHLVGEMRSEFEDLDEGFVEPLTVSQIEFCVFNEEDNETVFWSDQPDGSELVDGEDYVVGEMAGAGNSPAHPEGPCWFCSAPGHVKRSCPARLKAVHAKSGSTPRSSRGGRGGGGRSYQRLEEVRRGAPRRGRGRGRGSSSDSRRGIYPVRERRVGEISDVLHEEDPGLPEEEEVNGEVGGLYDSNYEQTGF